MYKFFEGRTFEMNVLEVLLKYIYSPTMKISIIIVWQFIEANIRLKYSYHFSLFVIIYTF